MRLLVVLLLLALVGAGCSADDQRPAPDKPSTAATATRGTDQVEPPPAARTEDEVLARVRAGVAAARAKEPIPSATAPSVTRLKGDYARGGGCPAFYRHDGDWQLCARGDTDGTKTMVVIGDSHARQWGSPLDILAERAGYTTYHLVRLGCPSADITPWLNKGDGPNTVCADFHEWSVEQVRALQPDVVVLATSFNPRGYVGPDGQQVSDEDERLQMLREGVVRLVDGLSPDAGRFVVIGDPPAVALSPVRCLLRAKTLDRCAAPGAELPTRAIEAVHEAADAAGATYIPTGQWFCADDLCPTVLGELLTYRDQNHVSDTYARYLTEVLGQRLALE